MKPMMAPWVWCKICGAAPSSRTSSIGPIASTETAPWRSTSTGAPDTLLVINPLVYGLATFRPIIEELCQEFRIITIDPRGVRADAVLGPPL